MKRPLIAVAVIALLAPLLSVMTPAAPPAEAASAANFNPGYIISDAVFYDGGSIDAGTVQTFLNGKVSSCSAGFTCLKDYRQATPSMAANSLCSAYAGSSGERAADIIAKVGAACNINPKVLLVLLEKEQSLVTMRNPGAGRYAAATGFGCPDTAPCDTTFSGFFYQVYYAARQFQNYSVNPTRWNYQAGRVNSILYNPNAACGRGNVYIQNKATAALYIYTPYQPNGAALGNLYGTGDGCSSYGNRNFWRIFSDWFGSPIEASSLLRTPDNASVYLVSGDNKYPISSSAVFAALSPLGKVGYVSQQYLNTLSTGHTVGRSIRDSSGTIYFYDSGIKLPFTSCAQAIDYGASCEASGYVQLTDIQAASFVTGPTLSNVLGTVDGARYYVKNGTRAEILDEQSQLAAGIPMGGMNVLTENAVADLAVAAPIVRDGVFAGTRGTSSVSLLASGQRHTVAGSDAAAVGATDRIAGRLWDASIAKIPAATASFAGVVTTGGSPVVLTSAGRYTISGGGLSALPAVTVPQAFVDGYPDLGTIAPGTFVKSPTRADVYVVMPNDVRPIAGWDALLALTPDGNPKIVVIPDALVARFTFGPVALTAGTLVRSPANATVYYVNGVTSRIALSSFEFTSEAGITKLVYSTDAIIQAYPLDTNLMTFGFSCGVDKYVAAGGSVHYVAPALEALYPFTYLALDSFSCQQIPKGVDATSFIRTPDGSIFQLVAGQKRPIGTMARYQQLSGGAGFLTVLPRFANTYPTGPAA